MTSILGLLLILMPILVCITTGAIVINMWKDSDTCSRWILVGICTFIVMVVILMISIILGMIVV